MSKRKVYDKGPDVNAARPLTEHFAHGRASRRRAKRYEAKVAQFETTAAERLARLAQGAVTK